MHLIYNIGIYLYEIIITIISPFNIKAKKWKVGRKDFFVKLPQIDCSNIHWFHCASLGEFDQALPVMNLLKEKDSSIFILVTFFSPSGFEHYHKRKHRADYVCYLPSDSPKNAERFINHFSPKKVYFVKYEFWANYIFEAKKKGAELYSISAVFRENQHFFKSENNFFAKTLKQFDHFFVQNKKSEELLQTININNISITGDTRFDRVIENKQNLTLNPVIEKFKNNKKVWVIGSSWPEDEAILWKSINLTNYKVIIAPHDISEKHINQINSNINTSSIRYSKIQDDTNLTNTNVLILDTIGHLANAYHYGDFAYIGGGFKGSLHNILEPAVFGLPILFGPKHVKFPEASLFLEKGIAYQVENSKDVLKWIKKWYNEDLTAIKSKVKSIVDENKGASTKITHHILKQL